MIYLRYFFDNIPLVKKFLSKNWKILAVAALIATGAGGYFVYKQAKDSPDAQKYALRNKTASETDSMYVSEIMTKCAKVEYPAVCSKQAANLFLSYMDYDQVLTALKISSKDPTVYANCHPLVHFLGREGYKKEHNVKTLYAKDRSVCDSGFYHGVMEQLFEEKDIPLFKESDTKIVDVMKSACGQKTDYEIPIRYSACIHGVGHALMFISNDDLPKSLEHCRILTKDQGRRTCYGGVFMENAGSVTNPYHISKYLKKDDPLYPCNWVGVKSEATCYQYQALYFAKITNNDWKKTSELCDTEPEKYKGNCFQFIGSNLLNFTEDNQKIKEVSDFIPPLFLPNYFRGVVSGIGEANVGVPTKMQDSCNQAASAAHLENCLGNIALAVKQWSTDVSQHSRWCEELGATAKKSCLKGL